MTGDLAASESTVLRRLAAPRDGVRFISLWDYRPPVTAPLEVESFWNDLLGMILDRFECTRDDNSDIDGFDFETLVEPKIKIDETHYPIDRSGNRVTDPQKAFEMVQDAAAERVAELEWMDFKEKNLEKLRAKKKKEANKEMLGKLLDMIEEEKEKEDQKRKKKKDEEEEGWVMVVENQRKKVLEKRNKEENEKTLENLLEKIKKGKKEKEGEEDEEDEEAPRTWKKTRRGKRGGKGRKKVEASEKAHEK